MQMQFVIAMAFATLTALGDEWCAHGDPTGRGWVLDWSTWIMTAQQPAISGQ